MNRLAAILSLAALVDLPLKAIAATTPRIAITVEQDDTIDRASITRLINAITSGLLKQRHFLVVERGKLDAIIKEQGLSNSAYADPSTAAALGRLVGASRLLHVAVSSETARSAGAYLVTYSVDIVASFSMIGIDSGRVLAAGTASGNAQKQLPSSGGTVPENALRREAVDACADDLVTQLSLPTNK